MNPVKISPRYKNGRVVGYKKNIANRTINLGPDRERAEKLVVLTPDLGPKRVRLSG